MAACIYTGNPHIVFPNPSLVIPGADPTCEQSGAFEPTGKNFFQILKLVGIEVAMLQNWPSNIHISGIDNAREAAPVLSQ